MACHGTTGHSAPRLQPRNKCGAQEELCSGKLPSMTPLKALPSYYKADDIEVTGGGGVEDLGSRGLGFRGWA